MSLSALELLQGRTVGFQIGAPKFQVRLKWLPSAHSFHALTKTTPSPRRPPVAPRERIYRGLNSAKRRSRPGELPTNIPASLAPRGVLSQRGVTPGQRT